MTVDELIRTLEPMPRDAKVVTYTRCGTADAVEAYINGLDEAVIEVAGGVCQHLAVQNPNGNSD